MRNLLKISLLAAVLTPCIAGCEKVEKNKTIPAFEEDLVILTEGNMNQNNASVYYLGKNEQFSFEQQNKFALGDTGQDIIRLSDGGYCIAVAGSRCIYFTDNRLKVLKTITPQVEGAAASPRSLAEKDGIVYASLYEGWICRIKPADNYSIDAVKVGPNPEGITVCGNFLYVANSGGMLDGYIYNDTVSKIDLGSFTAVQKDGADLEIKVGLNPINIRTIGEKIYVQYQGNYGDKRASVCVIDSSNDSVSDIETLAGANGIDVLDNEEILCMTVQYDENWNTVCQILSFNSTNRTTRILCEAIDNGYSICACEGFYMVGLSDYKTTGKVNIYDRRGILLQSVSAGGLNPRKILVVKSMS